MGPIYDTNFRSIQGMFGQRRPSPLCQCESCKKPAVSMLSEVSLRLETPSLGTKPLSCQLAQRFLVAEGKLHHAAPYTSKLGPRAYHVATRCKSSNRCLRGSVGVDPQVPWAIPSIYTRSLYLYTLPHSLGASTLCAPRP